MWAVLKFLLFNSVLSTTDVLTDLLTFFDLREDNPRWASLTLFWMLNPFIVHTLLFLYKKAKGKCEACTDFSEFMSQFYKEAGVHFPFFLPLVNLWRAKKLHQLGFGKGFIKSENREAVDKILAEVALTSYTECFYEAGPQAVTQVFQQQYVRGCVF